MRLRQLRMEKGLLQKDIAQLLGVDRTTYAKYESEASEPNRDTLVKLAEIFDVSTDYLLEVTDRKRKSSAESGGLDDMERQLMAYVKDMTLDQKKLLLAQMKIMSEQNK